MHSPSHQFADIPSPRGTGPLLSLYPRKACPPPNAEQCHAINFVQLQPRQNSKREVEKSRGDLFPALFATLISRTKQTCFLQR
jgi:hypothetical protein